MAILCGTDLSPGSLAALDVAIALAARCGETEVVAVYAADPAAAGGAVVTSDLGLAEARERLDAILAERTRAGITLRGEVVTGAADEVIVSMADTEHGTLIVLSTNSGASPAPRLGATATKVISHATVPVIGVRDPAPWLAFASGARPLRVLVGVDDSAACEIGIQWLQALRAQGPIDVVLGAVYYPDDAATQYGLDQGPLVDRDPDVEALLERDLLRRFNSTIGIADAGVRARSIRGLGRIGDHMIELANEERVDVILVGTSHKTGLGRLGSVSSVIMNDAPQSVICVPPQAHVTTHALPNLRVALVATDLSEFANRAVPYAFSIVQGPSRVTGGAVHILHVVKNDEEFDEPAVRAALAALAPAGPVRDVTTHIVRGDDAATCIAQTAARLGVDVICIASHGRSGISRAFVGSVADRLLRGTRVPVLVLRPA